MNNIAPRPYQEELVRSVFKRWKTHDSTLAVASTGTGKTVCVGMIAGRIPRDRRMLVVVNRTELLHQFCGTLRAMLPGDVVEVECGKRHATRIHSQGGRSQSCGRIVVAMLQTLAVKKRLLDFHPKEFGHIAFDEAHHHQSSSSQTRAIMGHFEECKSVGLTATPDRLDGISLRKYFPSVAYNYGILDAVGDGWLVPVRQVFEEVVGWDLSMLKKIKGDFPIGELDRISRQEKPSHAVASGAIKWAEAGGARKPCLIFAVSVDHAKLVADILNRHREGCAVSLDGSVRPEVRRKQLNRFAAGEYQYLVGADLFLEGFDEPTIEVIVLGRPTASRRYCQQIGRGLRPHPSIVQLLNAESDPAARRLIIRESPKPCVTVVDMVGVSAEHKLVVRSTDVLGGWLPASVREEALEIIRDGCGAPEVNEALEMAVEKLNDKERRRRALVIMSATLEDREVDPFDLTDVRPRREPMVLRGKKITERMLAFLDRYDVPVTAETSFWNAKVLIDGIAKKRDEGPPSPKMAQLLSKFGHDPSRMNWAQAKEAIDALAADGWRTVDL